MMNNIYIKQIGMYVHIPFCVRKCAYCDFLSGPADDISIDSYVKRLVKEIRENDDLSSNDYKLKSVFFGGGTPSILNERQLSAILDAILDKYAGILDNPEITMECNPGTVSYDKLKALKCAGFNRISIGLQSADNNELKRIGRIHTFEEFVKSYEDARRAGFDNINVDLMSALPCQTLLTWEDTLNKVIELAPEHISAYSLILEEGTPLYDSVLRQRAEGIDILPDEDTEREMTYLANRLLKKNGYEHYEISNYAKPGFESIHNKSYWECVEYFGFGIGAASYYAGERWKNTNDLNQYISCDRIQKCEVEKLTIEDKMSEYMFLGLRKVKDGVSVSEFNKRFGRNFNDIYGEVTDRYIKLGMLKMCGDRLVLTDKGVDVSNVIMADYI